ncbi:MAG: YebC/PmpR family DNA-binding transcriptional regulator [Tenericutes bacterium]|nr:YebC/PmpR family DNA-binding transcriptional regulator [Mycoplasmatota bacterium]
MGRAHEVRAASMAKTAAKKSKLYSIYAKEIFQAAKSNPDPATNDILRRVIEKAKREQVPADVIARNIEKVKKGTTESYDTVEYEAFAQGGSNLIIKCLTDNSNRTLSYLKTAFNKCGAKMATQNSVSFMYDHFGVVGLKDKSEEDVMNALITGDVDVADIEVEEDITVVYTDVINLNNAKKALEDFFGEIVFEIDEISYFAKDTIKLNEEDEEKFKRLISMLEEIDDVSDVYHNVELL